MTEPRHAHSGPPTARPWSALPEGQAGARPRRPRIVDEERRLLRQAHESLAGAHVKRADVDAFGHLAWDEEPGTSEAQPSRLFRE
ncbi:hypothetical protein [Xanthobacter tagetidis]|jgi:hypothetical protein|uniref:Uncharacterized protein n=1 Tax=Xanthobacter tagetidis TaxID=60216 RepID=A0A3L7AHY2_9HYPH|nr:hypothetical protein [Xanthobacter tagetidis]MBB6306820.1 hypothetical protein [Xanthobacter tagetidis]RLP80106.1 hypothetical protein D9R14_07060 [Xanthobacter tagetidis]